MVLILFSREVSRSSRPTSKRFFHQGINLDSFRQRESWREEIGFFGQGSVYVWRSSKGDSAFSPSDSHAVFVWPYLYECNDTTKLLHCWVAVYSTVVDGSLDR